MNVKDYYEHYWDEKQSIKGGMFNDIPIWTTWNLSFHFSFFNDFIGAKVLDLGAGDGTFLNYIIRNNKNIKEACAVEISENAINKGTKKHPNVIFKQSEIEKLSFESNYFDTAFAIEVVEHLLDIDTCFSEINRVLKVRGYLCVTTSDFNVLKRLLIAAFFWDKFFYPNNPHIRFFNKKALTKIANKHGFERIKHKWNGDYYRIMPKGQIAVFRKIRNNGTNNS